MKIKKIFTLMLSLSMLFSFVACSGGNSEPESSNAEASQSISETSNAQDTDSKSAETTEISDPSLPETEDGKILVAYFSATGTTEEIAQRLAAGLEADLYEIVPAIPYTSEDLNYNDNNSRSSVEMNDPNARPEISGSVENMEQYDIVLIGYPIWWGEAPRIMSTFIESYDFSGKTMAAFCTSGSSGFGRSDSALRDSANSATWLEGIRFSGRASTEEILEWANGLGIGGE